MEYLKITIQLLIILILLFISVLLYTTIYTSDGENRVVYIYENMLDAEIEYYDN